MTDMIVYLLIGLNLAMLGWLIFLNGKYRLITKKASILFTEKVSSDLGETLKQYLEDVKKVEDHCYLIDKKLTKVDKISAKGLHKVGFLRYNPFGDVGGNQSFSLCLLDGSESGFVISSIHSRDGTRVYAKTVSRGVSDYNLSEEEKKVIELAKK